MQAIDFKNIQTIIWDWNGTLLNDLSICIDSMNPLLTNRGLPLLTKEQYRQVFTFPVKNYYQTLGFDFSKEPFEVPALQFMNNYHKLLPKAELFEPVKNTLAYFKKKGFRQFILSAMEQQDLEKSIKALGILPYFEALFGIENHFAAGKVHRGIELMKTWKLTRHKTLLIGDTLHDQEVAKQLACHCVLVAKGHQTPERLQVNENVVLKNLSDLLSLF
jgi:phosphoglycolate phosphatase